MARTEIRVAGDGYGDPTGAVDATDAIRRADADAARHGCDLVIDGDFRVSCPQPMPGRNIACPAVQFFAPRVVGERGQSRVFLAEAQIPGAAGDVLAMVGFAHDRDGLVIRDVTFDARAAHQPAGFVAHALRLQRCRNSDIVATVKNAPGNTTKGYGETFHFQDLAGDGGRFSIDAITDDGGDTATGIVVQMRAPDARPWLLYDWNASGMRRGQGVGTYQGGTGTIGRGTARDCGAAGVNLEAGPKGTTAITVGEPDADAPSVRVIGCDRGLAVNGNGPPGSPQIGVVKVFGFEAVDCNRGVWLVNEPCGPVVMDRLSIVAPRIAAIDLGGGPLATRRAELLSITAGRVVLRDGTAEGSVDRGVRPARLVAGGAASSHWQLELHQQ